MRVVHIGLILAGLALFLIFAGCASNPAGMTDASGMHCGPGGCQIPDAYGHYAPMPTTQPSTTISPIAAPAHSSPLPTKG